MNKLYLFLLLISSVAFGEDIPNKGHSLFDQFISEENEIPYPFTKMMRKLKEFSSNPYSGQGGVLLPFGRSLQKPFAVEPNPIVYPRVIYSEGMLPSIFNNDKKYKKNNTVDTNSRIFLGFHEPKKQIEVISWNEKRGRFEFQLIKNYGEGEEPVVQYAPRSLCIRCHQNEAPIFPGLPWQETNASFGLAALISKSRVEAGLDGEKYQDVFIKGDGDRRRATPRMAQFYENSVFRANDLVDAQKVWKKVCIDKENKKDIECVKRFFFDSIIHHSFRNDLGEKLVNFQIKDWVIENLNQVGELTRQFGFFIPVRDPLSEAYKELDIFQVNTIEKGYLQVDKILDHEKSFKKVIERMLDLSLTDEQKPEISRKRERGERSSSIGQNAKEALFLIGRILKGFDEQEFEKTYLYNNELEADGLLTISSSRDGSYKVKSTFTKLEQTDFDFSEAEAKELPHYEFNRSASLFVNQDNFGIVKEIKVTEELNKEKRYNIFKILVNKEHELECLKYEEDFFCVNMQLNQLKKTIELMSQNHPELFSTDVLREMKIREFIANGDLKPYWKKMESTQVKKKLFKGFDRVEILNEITNPGVKNIVKYCSRCHYGEDSLATTLFEGETEFDIINSMKKWKIDMHDKLVKERGFMPPRKSPEYKDLMINENEKEAMIKALQE